VIVKEPLPSVVTSRPLTAAGSATEGFDTTLTGALVPAVFEAVKV